MHRRASAMVAALLIGGALAVPAGQAQATFPGAPGKIVFVSSRDQVGPCYGDSSCNTEIYVMRPDGTGQTRLTRDPAYDAHPTWSPDGRKIAFDRDFDLWVMNADGSNQHKIADYGADPAWSPDGRHLVFQDGCCDTLGVVNVDGSGRRVLTTADSPYDPDWSPDGTSIAYQATGPKIFTIRPDGTGRKFLGHYAFGPSWAPDGGRLAVSERYSGVKRAIFVIDVGRNSIRQVTGNAYLDEAPAWSPNGASIAFDSLRAERKPGACYPSCNSEIYTVASDGSGLRRLTTNPAQDFDPDWQPRP